MEYKRKWSNYIYNFEHHVVFLNNSFKLKYFGKVEFIKVKIKEYLKSKKMDVLIRSIKERLSGVNKINPSNKDLEYEITNVAFHDINNDDWITADWHNEEYAFLRKHIYNFLYINIQNINDIDVLKDCQGANSYLIKGGGKLQKVIFNAAKT